MRGNFPGYFSLSEEDKEKIWSEGVISFDANALLNIYRYQPETSVVFLKLVEENKNRVWLTHQATREFLRNRPKVILDETKKYEKVKKEIDDVFLKFDENRAHPFIARKTYESAKEALGVLADELIDTKNQRSQLVDDDPSLDKLADIFETRVGCEPSVETRNQWLTDAEARYEKRIPPGYKDSDKPGEMRFGDALIWFELLEKAEQDTVSMIFVTTETKEDWKWIVSGKDLGPRPELVHEFHERAKTNILIVTPELFIKHLSALGGGTASKEVLQDVRDVSVAQSEHYYPHLDTQSRRDQLKHDSVLVYDSLGVLDELLDTVSAIPHEHWVHFRSPLDLPDDVFRRLLVLSTNHGKMLGVLVELLRLDDDDWAYQVTSVTKHGEEVVRRLQQLREFPRYFVESMLSLLRFNPVSQ